MEYGNKRVLRYLFIISALFAILFYIRFFNKSVNLKNLGSCFAYPFLIIQNKIFNIISTSSERKKSYKELVGELERYIAECEDLKNENILLKSTLNYSNQTQELAEFTKQYKNLKTKLAQIIHKNFSENSQFFLINLGSKAGIKTDMTALYKNFLIGKVTESYPYWSKVTLVTDKFCKVACTIIPTGAKGISEGSGKLKRLNLNFISHLEKINIDNLVISSGEGLIFPQGFSLGKIKDFRLNGLHYEIVIEPEIDFSKLNYCYIVQRGEFNSDPADPA